MLFFGFRFSPDNTSISHNVVMTISLLNFGAKFVHSIRNTLKLSTNTFIIVLRSSQDIFFGRKLDIVNEKHLLFCMNNKCPCAKCFKMLAFCCCCCWVSFVCGLVVGLGFFLGGWGLIQIL